MEAARQFTHGNLHPPGLHRSMERGRTRSSSTHTLLGHGQSRPHLPLDMDPIPHLASLTPPAKTITSPQLHHSNRSHARRHPLHGEPYMLSPPTAHRLR
jgi:hypothetical protein